MLVTETSARNEKEIDVEIENSSEFLNLKAAVTSEVK